jgi:hypothetical protein
MENAMLDLNTLLRAVNFFPLSSTNLGRNESFVRTWRLGLLAFLITVAFAAALSAQNPQTGESWKVVKSPNGSNCRGLLCLTQGEGNIFLATTALSPTDAWAVGAEPNQSQFLTATLAEHWDGSRWSVVRTPPIPSPLVQLNSPSSCGQQRRLGSRIRREFFLPLWKNCH